MRIAIVHELWGAGAARCAKDLERELGRRHTMLYLPRQDLCDPAQIMTALREFKPDVVNCHSFYGNLPYSLLAEISRRFSTCFTIHDPRPIGTADPVCWNCAEYKTCRYCPLIGSTWRQIARNPYYASRRLKRATHARCDERMQIVAPSRWMLERLKGSELGRFSISHIPYGVDLEQFQRRSNTRGDFGLPEGRPVVLFSAWYETPRQVGARKGLADLADAFVNHVLVEIPDAVLAVAGESFAPNHPNVYPLGLISTERVPRLLSAADVYVLPTLADNLPYSIIEAMACQLPIVSTTVGGIPEQIASGVNGIVVPPANSAELGSAIIKILRDPQTAESMSMEGRARAEAFFAMGGFVNAYEKLFFDMSCRDAIVRSGE